MPDLADAMNGAFSPPAEYLYQLDGYYTSCDAIAPHLSVFIGDIPFVINPADLIFRREPDGPTGLCMTAIGSAGSGPSILGDPFLQNVVAIFDVGNARMRFLARPYYGV